LQQEFGAPIYLHRDDAKLIRSANFLMMACGIRGHVTVPEVDCFVEDGAQVDVGPDALRFVHTPGHTPGSCVVHYRDSLFTGDTIYRDGVGLVDFPGEDKAQLRASILKVWERFEDNIWARPGHGGAGLFGSLKAENLPLRQFLALGAAQVT
jgi:hydroxyacylglutathione hydrolase